MTTKDVMSILHVRLPPLKKKIRVNNCLLFSLFPLENSHTYIWIMLLPQKITNLPEILTTWDYCCVLRSIFYFHPLFHFTFYCTIIVIKMLPFWYFGVWTYFLLLGCSFLPLHDHLLSLLGLLHPFSLWQISCPQVTVLGSLSIMFQDSLKLYLQDINLATGPMLLLYQIL